MKLIALWVEDFMRVQNTGFNFGSELTFDFEFDADNGALSIASRNTPEYFDLFSAYGILNITGVVGTNGAGKTTLLKILNTLYSRKPLMKHVVTIWKEENGSFIINDYINEDSFFNRNPLKILLDEFGPLSHDALDKKQVKIITKRSPFRELDLIFYSNLYSSQNDNYLGTDNPLNRSVDYQTIKSLNADRLQKYVESYNQKEERKVLFNDESYNPLAMYHYDKIGRLINFLAAADDDLELHFKNDIKFPSTVSVWLNESIPERVFQVAEKSIHNFSKVKEIYEWCFTSNANEKEPKQKFKNALSYTLFFFSFYNDSFKKSKEGGSLTDIENFFNRLEKNESVFETIKDFMLAQKSQRADEQIDMIRNVLFSLDTLLENIDVQYENYAAGKLYELSINKQLWDFLSKILEITDFYGEAPLTLSLTPFSAGENAILGQFSEFYEALKHVNTSNSLVIIDEGELYLHPEWQRKYINALFLFFEYYARKRDISFQIIVTSHSPFIVSDLPKFNLVFMDKDANGFTVVEQAQEQKPTLGGNVFELFQDGFYMTEFIGEFAFNKINDAISFLNGADSSFKTLNEVERFVLLIGESIIRRELQRVIELRKIENLGQYYEAAKEDDITIITNRAKEDKDSNKNNPKK